MANARNNNLFQRDEDRVCLARILHALLAADDQSPFRVLVLPRFWQKDPWPHMAPEDQPEKWDNRVPVIVVPESPDDEQAALGRWLKENLATRRNTVRFLLPPKGAASIYTQAEMILSARAVKLAADWQAGEPEYKKLREIRGEAGEAADQAPRRETEDDDAAAAEAVAEKSGLSALSSFSA